MTTNLVGLACLAISASCAGRQPPAAAPGEVMVRIGRGCPALATGDAPSMVFLELTDTRLPRRTDLADALELPLPIRGSGGMLAALGETVSVPWGGCLAEPCEPQLGTLTVTSRLRATDAKLLELTVQLAPAGGSSQPPLTTRLEARHQEPVLLRFDKRVPAKPIAWIVTPYLVSSRENLRPLQECRMAAVQAASR